MRSLLLALFLLATPAAAQPAPMGMAQSPADAALMQSMGDMQHGMSSAPMTGDADADFVRSMLAHHKGAVAMAQVELQYGKDRAMRALATSIIASQGKEIARMQSWLDAHKGR